MVTYVLDTNVLVRFLIGDIAKLQIEARKWLDEAKKGERKIFISSLVIAEAVYVLRSSYKMPFVEISEAMEALVNASWLQVENRELQNLALGLLRNGKHFVDSYLLAMQQVYDYRILTFDKKLKKQAESEF